MEYVGDLCSPCLFHEQPKGEFIIVSHTGLLYVCLMAVTLVPVLSLTMNVFDKSKCKKHSFEALKVVDKPSYVIN